MPDSPTWDKVFATVSWILVLLLIYAALMVWFSPPFVNGPVAQLTSVYFAEWFYSTFYTLTALSLAYSKLFKKKRMRKHVLLVIYLFGIFTGILTYASFGVGISLADNLITAAIAATCWLWWTFKTEYIDPSAIYEDTYHLRDDMPDKP